MTGEQGSRPDEPEPPGYAAMLEELDAILAELEGEAVDVDRLAARVARAHELMAACRSRIDHARMEVERIVPPPAPP